MTQLCANLIGSLIEIRCDVDGLKGHLMPVVSPSRLQLMTIYGLTIDFDRVIS